MAQESHAERRYLAVDIGGTKVATALVGQSGRIDGSLREPTCQNGPQEGILQIVRLLEQTLAAGGLTANEVAAVGIGIPAVLETDTDRVLRAPNLAGWRNVELSTPISEALGLPVALEYDGHTATLAEWWIGAGKGINSFVNVIIGTGIGGGMVLEGQLIRGVNRLAGAVGWSALTTDAARANEHQRSVGFWEAEAAGPGIVRRAKIAAGRGSSSLPANGALYQTAEAVFEAASRGEPVAVKVVDETADLIGLGVANIISLVNPRLVVLGGGVGSQCDALLPRIQDVVQRWAQPVSASSCRIAVSTLGPDAGLLGAACAAMLREPKCTPSAVG